MINEAGRGRVALNVLSACNAWRGAV